jgi:hypothetical protein
MEAPKFNLNAKSIGLTDEALQGELEKQGGKYFEPGNYDLKIVSADFHANKDTQSIYCTGDETWFNVALELQGVDDRKTKYWLQVPTSKVTFGKKNTFFVFKKFAEFMAAIGSPVVATNLGKVVPKFFSAPKDTLVGLKLNADIGYDGPYVDRVGETEYRIIKARDKPVLDEGGEPMTFPDAASAKAAADGMGIKTGFAGIIKFTPVKVAPAPDAKPESDDW